LGWALVEEGRVRESGFQLIDPQVAESEWSHFNIGLHGIRPTDVRGAPSFAEVWGHLLAVASGRPIVAHYAAFDTGVIREEHGRFAIEVVPFQYACSARLSQVAWPTLLSVSLPVVATWLGLELRHHDARSDAEVAGLVTLEAIRTIGAPDLSTAMERSSLLWGQVRAGGAWTRFGSTPMVGTRSLDQSYEALGIQRGADPSHPLFGQVVVFTGALQTMARAEAHRLVYEAGGTPGNSVTKNTTLLVSGEQDFTRFAPGVHQSAKFRKAQQLRDAGCEIELVAEEDFLRLV
jgi:DNA polymerase-3 subunit epsilon